MAKTIDCKLRQDVILSLSKFFRRAKSTFYFLWSLRNILYLHVGIQKKFYQNLSRTELNSKHAFEYFEYLITIMF